MTLTFHLGDAATQLRALPDASVQLCITSPPYHGQRRYHAGPQEIGSEPTWAEHLEALLAVFDEVHRVLRPDGVLWVNYGDKYAGGGNGGGGSFASDLPGRTPEPGTDKNKRFGQPNGLGLPDKNLLGLPFRLVMALQERGWFWRAYCPWVKRNGLPDSAADRPGMNLEHLFMLTKSDETQYWTHPTLRGVRTPPAPDYRWLDRVSGEETAEEPPHWRTQTYGEPDPKTGKRKKRWARTNLWDGHDYFWDAEAVRLTYAPATVARYEQAERTGGKAIDYQAPGQCATGIRRETAHPGRARRMGDAWVESMRGIVGCAHQEAPRYTEANQSWDRDSKEADVPGARSKQHRSGRDTGMRATPTWKDDGRPLDPRERNAAWPREAQQMRSGATGGLALAPDGTPLGLYLATEGFNGKRFAPEGSDVDHYATFPTGLVEPLILSGTSAKGCCPACGAPWVRVVAVDEAMASSRRGTEDYQSGGMDTGKRFTSATPGYITPTQTIGWRPTCGCTVTPPFGPGEMQAMPLPPIPCTVLDPFLGAGTTLLVAERLGRHGVGIELNPDYLAMARRRIETDDAARVARLERAQGTLLEVEA